MSKRSQWIVCCSAVLALILFLLLLLSIPREKQLSRQIPTEINHYRTPELRPVRPRVLRTAVCISRSPNNTIPDDASEGALGSRRRR